MKRRYAVKSWKRGEWSTTTVRNGVTTKRSATVEIFVDWHALEKYFAGRVLRLKCGRTTFHGGVIVARVITGTLKETSVVLPEVPS